MRAASSAPVISHRGRRLNVEKFMCLPLSWMSLPAVRVR
jgi:hypothetical protein